VSRPTLAILAGAVLVAACSSGSTTSPPTATVPPAVSTTPSSTAATTTPTTMTIPTTTTVPPTTTTVAPATTTTAFDAVQRVQIGTSVEGRPLTAVERGTPGGHAVLVIGCIHGDEQAGEQIVQQLMTAPVPAGVDLWLVSTMNPDGEAHHRRTNAHLVDLNRNFPFNWAPLGKPGDDEYAGPRPTSEPETAAVIALIRRVKPVLTVWYHQDLNRIDPATGHSGQVRQRYSEMTGIPLAPITGGTYTGTASTWAQTVVPAGVSFLVELGPSISGPQAQTNANAVLTLAASP
jgi:protein MpaA